MLAAILAMPVPASAFQTPLSNESIREAYFLGQRRDEAFARFLDSYTQHLAPPRSGPYIASVTLFTPFAMLVQQSGERTQGYSAQQAQADHLEKKEYVRVIVQILLTESYGPFLQAPTGSRSGSATGVALRSSDFWKDFEVRVFNGDNFVKPESARGEPAFSCNDGGCVLSGASLYFDFPASTFDATFASVEVYPPEGDSLAVDFDLNSLR